MGQYASRSEAFPLEDQLRNLADDELLDFWEESQLLDPFLLDDAQGADLVDPHYEQLILRELQMRTCRRRLTQPGAHP